MKWVGLTGGIATGKSTVAQILRESGLPVVDADALVHRILSLKGEGYQSIVSHFGESILLPSVDIDRGILGSIVFQNSEKLTELESILHPLVQLASQEERLRLEKQGCNLAFYEIPLLFEKNLEYRFDATVLVYASRKLQKERLMKRNQMSEEAAEQRLKAQIDIEEKVARAGWVIQNNSSLADLKSEVTAFLHSFSSESPTTSDD